MLQEGEGCILIKIDLLYDNIVSVCLYCDVYLYSVLLYGIHNVKGNYIYIKKGNFNINTNLIYFRYNY